MQRLVVLEASKTHDQHSTLVDGIVLADLARTGSKPTKVCAHPTLFKRLSAEVTDQAVYHPIPVMDPRRRRLLRKSFLEAWVVLRAIAGLRSDETLLVSTLLPSAGILVEIGQTFLPNKRTVIMLHGELEGLLSPNKQGVGSFGFYMRAWLGLRRIMGARLEFAVIAPFIHRAFLARAGRALGNQTLHLLPIPIEPSAAEKKPRQGPFRFGFVGFDTPNKGFTYFEALAKQFPDDEFVHIGGGQVRRLCSTEAPVELETAQDFMSQIAACDCTVFPYVGGYSLAMSAAATDAVAAGSHVLATGRPCFRDLQAAYGEGAVTIAERPEDLARLVSDAGWRRNVRRYRHSGGTNYAGSIYSLDSLTAHIGQMLENRKAP